VQNSGTFSARLSSSASLELRGTSQQPILSGDLEIDRGGEITLFGKRYVVTQGTVYFSNPSRIEPTIDIEAETRVRVPGETYRITASVRGGLSRIERPTFTSDPPLSDAEIYALLISDVPPGQDLELRQARGDSVAEQQLLRELAAQTVTGALSSQVNRAVEQTFGVNFSITPTLTDPDQQSSRAEPGARFLIGRRVGQNVYLQYSRSLSATNRDEIILLEYYPSDRFTWVLSRNEDQTYALEVRLRRSF
jgi:translocation and assembly module TamB